MKTYAPNLLYIRKKSFLRLSKTLLIILESSCDGSEKLSELYFFMCESLLLRLWHIAQRLESCTGEVYVW